jgi:hypothetical protein
LFSIASCSDPRRVNKGTRYHSVAVVKGTSLIPFSANLPSNDAQVVSIHNPDVWNTFGTPCGMLLCGQAADEGSIADINETPVSGLAHAEWEQFRACVFDDFVSNGILIQSIGIMKNDAHRVTLPRPQSADAMSKIYTVDTPRPLPRALVHGESHGVSLTQWDDFRPGLHPWTLFGQDELAAREISLRLGQKKGHLNRKNMFPVQILMPGSYSRRHHIGAATVSALLAPRCDNVR